MEGDEAKRLGDTVKVQDHSHDEANKNPVKNIKYINSQRTSNGAKDKPLMKGQDIKPDKKDKSIPKRGVVNTKENNQRSRIPVSENSNIIAVNHVNGDDSFKAQRKCSLLSEKVSSRDTKSSKTSSESVDIKGNKLYAEFMDIKLSSSHSLQQKPPDKSVEKQNSKGSVDTGMPARVLVTPAARRLKQRGGSRTETGTRETGHPHSVGQDNPNNVTNGDHQINVSSNIGNTEEGEISLRNAVRKSSRGSSMSVEYRRKRQVRKSSNDSLMSAENRTRAQKATKHGKISKKNAKRQHITMGQKGISNESVTQNSEISQGSLSSFSEGDDVMEGYPAPTPPSLLQPTTFSDGGLDTINDLVHKASLEETSSFDSLLQYLCGNLESDIARVRAIYCWIVSKRLPIFYDVTDIPSPETPIGYLCLILQRKGSYAALFCKMCRYINIPCVVIRGVSKGVAYDVGETIDHTKHGNSWNAVYVQENWRLVHCHWASRSARGYKSGEWVTLDCPEFRKDTVYGESRSYVVNSPINDWYFFTEPSVFIDKCFPNDDRWQLLPKKISKDEFESRPFLQPAFYALGLKLVEPNCSCVAHIHGKYVLQIRMPLETRDRLCFSYNLYFLRDFTDEGEYEYPTLERYTVHYCLNEVAFFEVRFPPLCVGEYKLQIYCCNNDICLPSEWICDFRIVCEIGMNVSVPLPVVPKIGWGRNSELAKYKITAVSHTGGLYSLDSGDVRFLFIFPLETDPRAELIKNGRSKSDFVENVKAKKNGVDVSITVEPSCEGEFALQIFCRDRGSQNEVNVCNYLLERTFSIESKSQEKARKHLLSAILRTTVTTQELTDAIEMFVSSGAIDRGELEAAKYKLYMLKQRDELLEAMARRNLDRLEKVLMDISDAKMENDIGVDLISNAAKLLAHLKRLLRFRAAVLEMDSKTISELRSYNKPPLAVHGVMVATYVLLGVDEGNEGYKYDKRHRGTEPNFKLKAGP
ncbi:lim and transglutaminase domain protein ltd-1-like, partial [Saccostrea cucullata]|uniref:lim and transglutaminase domain protein ltd-1-like n=1 Tax=Saccostrea cuccullata TaxID=36930 RepID=UPI002ED360F8